jgi:hypothetical protein
MPNPRACKHDSSFLTELKEDGHISIYGFIAYRDSITTKIYVMVAVVLLLLLMVSPNVSDNGVLP